MKRESEASVPKISEHDVQSQIIAWLELSRVFHYRQNTGAAKLKGFYVRFGTRGAPDIVAIVKGRYVGIEVKAKGGKQSEEQAQFQQCLEAAGGLYILAYKLEDVTEWLSPLRERGAA